MAKTTDSLLGEISGKIGNVVITKWKGIRVIRSLPVQNDPATPVQKEYRNKFTLVIRFINHIRPVINAGFKYNTERMTEMNSATSYLMKRAVSMDSGQPQLDYPAVLVARGDLAGPLYPSAQRTEEGIAFTWTYNKRQESARGDDQVIALAYDPENELGYYWIGEGAVREDELFLLPVLAGEGEQPLETYLAFAGADETDACDSAYLGRL
jgi:hypothetical protein